MLPMREDKNFVPKTRWPPESNVGPSKNIFMERVFLRLSQPVLAFSFFVALKVDPLCLYSQKHLFYLVHTDTFSFEILSRSSFAGMHSKEFKLINP